MKNLKSLFYLTLILLSLNATAQNITENSPQAQSENKQTLKTKWQNKFIEGYKKTSKFASKKTTDVKSYFKRNPKKSIAFGAFAGIFTVYSFFAYKTAKNYARSNNRSPNYHDYLVIPLIEIICEINNIIIDATSRQSSTDHITVTTVTEIQ